jgi:photosystem II stability/assembly factor-like uncharacterized protein
MNKHLALVFLFITNGLIAQNWELQNSGTKNTLMSVCFVDSLLGYVVGDNSTVLKTTNGGKNWVRLPIPIQSLPLRKVQFVSKTVGFIVSRNGSFLSTIDGGLSWSVSSIIPDSSGFYHEDLCFIDENEGWIPGRKEGKNYGIGVILHTTDGGKTWNKQLELKSYSQTDVKYFTSTKFINKQTGWALASDYFDNFSPTFLYGTKDGGNNWKIINLISFPVSDIKLINKDTLWIGRGSSAKLVKTFDGGITLNYSFLDTAFAFQFVPQSGLQGWVCHRKPFYFSNYNQILFTRDGGITWNEEYKVKETVWGLFTISNYLWIVGANGLILKKTPLKTSVKETQEISLEPKILLQNYPNPFNLLTNITYEVTSQSDIEVTIYNVIGEIIERKKYYSKLPGKYNFEWKGKDEFGKQLPSGIYLCNLNIINSKKIYRTNTIKMLLIK